MIPPNGKLEVFINEESVGIMFSVGLINFGIAFPWSNQLYFDNAGGGNPAL